MPSPRGEERPCLLQIGLRPRDAVREARLPPAGEELILLGLCQLELGSKGSSGLGKCVLLAIAGESQQREHQGLEIRNCHALPFSVWRTPGIRGAGTTEGQASKAEPTLIGAPCMPMLEPWFVNGERCRLVFSWHQSA